MKKAMNRFAELLDAVCPRHRQQKRPLAIEADAPGQLRAFWEAVGFSDAVGAGGGPKPQQWEPTRENSHAFLERTFTEWFSEDVQTRDAWGVEPNDFSAVWKRLPRKFRVLVADPKTPLLTDESGTEDNPPLLELKILRAQLLPQPDMAVERLIRATLNRVFTSRSAAAINFPLQGEQPLAPVFTGLYQQAEGVWGVDPGPKALERYRGKIFAFYFQSFDHYFDFVLSQPDERLPHFHAPHGEVFILKENARLDPQTLAEPGFRKYEDILVGPPRKHWLNAVGRIDGMRVWIHRTTDERTLMLTVGSRDFAAMKDWLRRNKVKLAERAELGTTDIWAEPATV